MEIDDSALQDSIKAEKIVLDQARGAMIAADEGYKIVVSQNTSEIETAKIVIQLAELDLEKYLKGEYEQAKKDVDNRILLAKADLGLQKDRLAWTERMVKMKYMSPTQEQSEVSRYKSLEVNLERVLEEQRVLEVFTKKRTITDLTGKVEEAKRALDRVLKQAKAKEIQAETDRSTKKSVFDQEQDKYDDIEEQIHHCQIHSPQDGMVVYYVSEQIRYGSGSSQSIIAQGEPVKEGQKLMRIPDLRRMLVNTKVHEAMVSRVHGELWQTTGFTDTLRAALLINNDATSRLLGQHALFEMKDKFRDQEMQKVIDGQKATVRVDAFPERVLPGHIKSVATVAAQQDWMSADVKVYQTMVSIDESLENLKPGMSAEVTMYVENLSENVLTVPLQAVVGGAEMGRKRKVFVTTPEGPQEREVVIGLSNEKLAEVKSGLEEGEQIVLNPRVLLGDRAKTREVIQTEKAGVNGPGGEGKGKGKGREGKGGPPPGMGDKGGPPDAGGGPGGMPARPAK
jgi:HlyD family secretion protein